MLNDMTNYATTPPSCIFSALDDETFEGLLDDVDEVFRFDRDNRPQDRAHAYLSHRGLGRSATDTAMQAAARDFVSRARQIGSKAPVTPAASLDPDAVAKARKTAQELALDLAILERGMA